MRTIFTFDSVAFCGYEQKTTFFADFSVAERFGLDEVKDTYKRARKEWKNNVEYFTELTMVLNWKSWVYTGKNNTLSDAYAGMYYEAYSYGLDNFKGEDLDYFIRTIDYD